MSPGKGIPGSPVHGPLPDRGPGQCDLVRRTAGCRHPGRQHHHRKRLQVTACSSPSFTGCSTLQTGTLTYVNAGHNPPIHLPGSGRDAGGTAATGIAMGVLDDAEYTQATVQMVTGDVLVLYTDGITEAENAAPRDVRRRPAGNNYPCIRRIICKQR